MRISILDPVSFFIGTRYSGVFTASSFGFMSHSFDPPPPPRVLPALLRELGFLEEGQSLFIPRALGVEWMDAWRNAASLRAERLLLT